MPVVVGVRLRTGGKIYFFDPENASYYRDECVLVETTRGLEVGRVKLPPHEVTDDEIVPPLRRVVRRAVADDLARDRANRAREEQALEACRRLVEKLQLPMRLIDAQYTFDGSNVLIHFLAEHRVDFRELVRDLARDLRTRIELRQVGVRDEAKLIGGYGVCGRRLCCAAFLTNFTPVAINMAKLQGLALNPQKISGSCGRLMCCLAYENEFYKDARTALPRLNAQVETPGGIGKVTKVNAISQQVEVVIPDEQSPIWYTVDEVRLVGAPVCCAEREEPCEACACSASHAEVEVAIEQVATADPVLVVESAEVEEEGATAATPRRPRRRRGKRGTGAAQPAPQATGSAPPASGAPAHTPRRPRPPRPQGAAQPANPVADGTVPSGRYRPRRRRPPRAPEA